MRPDLPFRNLMFQGSIAALITPMDAQGELDVASWRQLLRWHLAQGSNGIVVAGTTGESATLEDHEFAQLLSIALEELKGKIPVLAGTGTNATRSSVERTRQAEALGADGALIVTPYYNRPSQEGLAAHYRHIANAVELPIVLYNVPLRTGVDLHPKTVAELAQIEHIVALKEAYASPERLPQLQSLVSDDFIILSGDDESCANTIAQGADGVISVVANAAPAAMAQLAETARAAFRHDNTASNQAAPDYATLNRQLKPLYALAALGGNPTGIKWCLWQSQRIQRGIRLPLTWLHPDLESTAQALYRDVTPLVTR